MVPHTYMYMYLYMCACVLAQAMACSLTGSYAIGFTVTTCDNTGMLDHRLHKYINTHSNTARVKEMLTQQNKDKEDGNADGWLHFLGGERGRYGDLDSGRRVAMWAAE